MIHLNLIPQQLKKEIGFKIFYLSLKKSLIILIATVFLVSLIFGAIKFFALKQLDKIFESTADVAKQVDHENKIKDINNKIAEAVKIQNDFVSYSYLLAEIASNTPRGLVFSNIKISGDTKEMRLAGHSRKRQDLIDLRSNFLSSEICLEMELPIEDILKKENIDFEIAFKLNPKILINGK